MFSEKEVFTWCCFGIEVVPSNVSGTKLIIKLWQNIRYNLRNFFRGSVQNDLISKIRFSPLFLPVFDRGRKRTSVENSDPNDQKVHK